MEDNCKVLVVQEQKGINSVIIFRKFLGTFPNGTKAGNGREDVAVVVVLGHCTEWGVVSGCPQCVGARGTEGRSQLLASRRQLHRACELVQAESRSRAPAGSELLPQQHREIRPGIRLQQVYYPGQGQ
ncbi:hypothetical protein AAFF_G00257960 [Aldrovandia affinis]|uniref:Uncharacterized protein n=1 Tax=Aldrovandia affinis TaxID=143900 RepID=A0AAD7SUE7_9TELE|nr:hypothetical protein AAFF_G00257960 [Aldrovandia affinis]